jgi:hypothetical protein
MALEGGDLAQAEAQLPPLGRLDPDMARSLQGQIDRKRAGTK